MARSSAARPGRTLVVFFLGVVILFGLVAIGIVVISMIPVAWVALKK